METIGRFCSVLVCPSAFADRLKFRSLGGFLLRTPIGSRDQVFPSLDR